MTTGTTSTALADAAATADRSLARLEAVLGRIGDGDLHLAHRNGGWTPAQLVSHISLSTLVWLGDMERLRQDPGLGFFFQEEIGHDAVGLPPPTAERPAAEWRAPAGPGQLPAGHRPGRPGAHGPEDPDLGTMTVTEWVPLIVGHLTGHVDQAFEVLADGALPEGLGCRRPSSPGCTRSRTVPTRPPVPAGWWCGSSRHRCAAPTPTSTRRIDTPFPASPGTTSPGGWTASARGGRRRWSARRWRSSRRCPAGSAPTAQRAAGRLPAQAADGPLVGRLHGREGRGPASQPVPRPKGVEAWQASLLEPLAVGLNTVDRLRLVLGEIVLVLGQGPIGLALTRLCALSGAGRLIVTDAREAPFAVSRPYGATDCVNVAETDVRQAVADLTGGVGADVVIETSGFRVVGGGARRRPQGEQDRPHRLGQRPAAAAGDPDHGQDADGVRGRRQRRPRAVRARPRAGPVNRW